LRGDLESVPWKTGFSKNITNNVFFIALSYLVVFVGAFDQGAAGLQGPFRQALSEVKVAPRFSWC
jgi:hypothetical protein